MSEAIQTLTVAHEILRAHFSPDGKELIIESHVEIPVERHNLGSLRGDALEAKIKTFEDEIIRYPFNLETGPLVRVTCIVSGNNDYTILLGVHSSTVDLWSLNTLSRDLVKLYLSLAAQEPPCALPKYGFSDYIEYRAIPETSNQLQKSIMYWHSRLALPPLPYPPRPIFHEKPRPANRLYKAHTVKKQWSGNVVSMIKSFASHNGISVFSVLMAGLAKKIQFYTGSDDITAGIPFAGQLNCGMDGTAGRFVNLIPARFQLYSSSDFTELCRRSHESMSNEYDNSCIDIEDLAATLGFNHTKKEILTATRCLYIDTVQDRLNISDTPSATFSFITRCSTTANLEINFLEVRESLEVTILADADFTDKQWLNTFAQELEELFKQNCIVGTTTTISPDTSQEPTTFQEKIISDIWKQILKTENIRSNDSFYGLGGDSIQALQMLYEIERAFKVKIPLSVFITLDTIKKLTNHVNTLTSTQKTITLNSSAVSTVAVKKQDWNTIVTLNQEGDLPPFFCVSGLGGNPMIFQHLSRLLSKNQPFYALQFRGVDGIMTPHKRVEDMATEFMNDIRKVQPEGPYHLGGYSFGGLVAYEIVQRFIVNGESVGGLVLIDTFIPQFSKVVLKKSLRNIISKLIPTGSGYKIRRLSDHLRSLGLLPKKKLNLSNTFKNRFDLVASCNHLAGVQYKPQPMSANVLFIKSALPVTSDRYGHNLPFHRINEWNGLIHPDLLDLRHTQAHHYEILNEPHLYETAKNIREGMAALRAKGPVVSSMA
ncbi:MAG: hypothetical protein JW915_07230 [Chitinispirillaceae bacterium]|nr:hypothetical protein [Chitinispirillaceae bacterium]